MDLQGPAPEDDRALDYDMCVVGNGWSKIGDDVTDGAALTAVNTVHSGPAFSSGDSQVPFLRAAEISGVPIVSGVVTM